MDDVFGVCHVTDVSVVGFHEKYKKGSAGENMIIYIFGANKSNLETAVNMTNQRHFSSDRGTND